jgi:hypothetical protein
MFLSKKKNSFFSTEKFNKPNRIRLCGELKKCRVQEKEEEKDTTKEKAEA